jgi:hypothetical protein
VLRGQIVQGAATRGSRLNWAVLKQCSQVLEGLLPPMLHLTIEHGAQRYLAAALLADTMDDVHNRVLRRTD